MTDPRPEQVEALDAAIRQHQQVDHSDPCDPDCAWHILAAKPGYRYVPTEVADISLYTDLVEYESAIAAALEDKP